MPFPYRYDLHEPLNACFHLTVAHLPLSLHLREFGTYVLVNTRGGHLVTLHKPQRVELQLHCTRKLTSTSLSCFGVLPCSIDYGTVRQVYAVPVTCCPHSINPRAEKRRKKGPGLVPAKSK